MVDIVALFCNVDDFCKTNKLTKLNLLDNNKHTRNRKHLMSDSEIITILILFHTFQYRNFKHFYIDHVQQHLAHYFPKTLSYNRFVEIAKTQLINMCNFLTSKLDTCTGVSFIDSTKLQVCHKKRIARNKVFKNTAKIGKTTYGWFFGFKLHLIVNEHGGLIAVKITPGNVDDKEPVQNMLKKLMGKLFGDKGYISQKLANDLKKKGVQLITSVRKNMKNKFMPLIDKILLRKRSIIETINDQLKNISQIEHTRHRSIYNFMINILGGLIAYTFQDKKPSISGIRYENYLALNNA